MSNPDRSAGDSDDPESALSPLKVRFVELLATGQTMAGAATSLGKSERTLRRWRAAPEVRTVLRSRLGEALQRARSVLAAGAGEGAAALVDTAAGRLVPDAARVSAARSVVELATKLADSEALEQRLAALEARLDAREMQK